MKAAYIDTSLLIGIKFQGCSARTKRTISEHHLYSSELLLAEALAFARRESLPEDLVSAAVAGIGWIIPDRSLAPEIEGILRQGYVRGADAWHLACALYLSPVPSELWFLTLDEQQRDIAGRMGFDIPDLR